MYPILIPSKGRSETAAFPRLLRKHRIPFTLMVEKPEFKSYRTEFPDSHILCIDPPDEPSVVHVRNKCIEYAESIGAEYHWQIDDNIRYMYHWSNGHRNRDTSIPEMFSLSEQWTDVYGNIGQLGLSYDSFGKLERRRFKTNQQIASCMLIRSGMGLRFRLHTPEDTDFSLQVLTAGWCTVQLFSFLIYKPTPGSQNGGNTAVGHYSDSSLQKMFDTMMGYWPQITQIVDKQTGPRLYTAHVWERFSQVPLRTEGSEMYSRFRDVFQITGDQTQLDLDLHPGQR